MAAREKGQVIMTRKPLISAGIFMGVGLGGFVDGILFHQILQVHAMLTAKYPKDSFANYQINMVWDGLFHAVTWLMTALGLALLWRAGQRTDVPWCGRTFLGSMILGWGLFNFVEGVIDHHILHIHHVVEAMGVSVWDYVFLGSGVLFIAIGWGLIHAARRQAALPRGGMQAVRP
jgi:uncharacterized membrane protein